MKNIRDLQRKKVRNSGKKHDEDDSRNRKSPDPRVSEKNIGELRNPRSDKSESETETPKFRKG